MSIAYEIMCDSMTWLAIRAKIRDWDATMMRVCFTRMTSSATSSSTSPLLYQAVFHLFCLIINASLYLNAENIDFTHR